MDLQIYLFLIIPFIFTVGAFYLSKKDKTKKIAVIVGLSTILLSFLAILLTKYVSVNNATSDTEYIGSYVVKAYRVEDYSTWVEETCYRQVACGTDSKGNTEYCTESYDCSSCHYYPEEYFVVDNLSKETSISKEEYYRLKKLWNSTETFIELNRNIDYHGSCGKDGDMYSISWDGLDIHSLNITTMHTYENKLQACATIYDFETIEDSVAIKDGLYSYPPINYLEQSPILGFEKLGIPMSYNRYTEIENKFKHINGELGNVKQVKMFLLIFKDNSQEIAIKQQNYWKGGNKNEIVICVGYDSLTKNLSWVRPFSWCSDKKIEVELREDIMGLKKITNSNLDTLHNIIKNDIFLYFNRRHFKEFNYLNVDVPKGAYILAFFFTCIITGIGFFIGYQITKDINYDKWNRYRSY